MNIHQKELENQTIGKLIIYDKYKLIDKNIIAEVVKDTLKSLIYEGDISC